MKLKQPILEKKIRTLLKGTIGELKSYGSSMQGYIDRYSDIDLSVKSKDPEKEYLVTCRTFQNESNFVLGYPVPYMIHKIVYTSFWKMDNDLYSLDLSFIPKKKSQTGFDQLEYDEYYRFSGLSWHAYVALQRRDLVELGNLMSYIREIHLFSQIKKQFKIKSLKNSNKSIDKKTYRSILKTYTDFSSTSKIRAAYKNLIFITSDLYRRENNFIMEYILDHI